MRKTLGLLVVLAACGGVDDLDATTDELTFYPAPGSPQEFHILPSDTSLPTYGPIGAGGTWAPNRLHYAYRNAVGAACLSPCTTYKLVVVLPGCSGSPSAMQAFMTTARNQGFHVIGLDYPNPCGLSDTCGSDLACFGKYRDEVAFGDVGSPDAQLDGHVQDSISKRLKALLLELQQRDPYGWWSAFLVADSSFPEGVRPNYDLITIAGHSQGAGMAGYIAHAKTVRRAVMLANPADAVGAPDDIDPTVATWLTTTNATPGGRYYGLVNVDDPNYYKTLACWDVLGMTGLHGNLGSQECAAAPDPHNSVAKCEAEYGDTWKSMLGTPN